MKKCMVGSVLDIRIAWFGSDEWGLVAMGCALKKYHDTPGSYMFFSSRQRPKYDVGSSQGRSDFISVGSEVHPGKTHIERCRCDGWKIAAYMRGMTRFVKNRMIDLTRRISIILDSIDVETLSESRSRHKGSQSASHNATSSLKSNGL